MRESECKTVSIARPNIVLSVRSRVYLDSCMLLVLPSRLVVNYEID